MTLAISNLEVGLWILNFSRPMLREWPIIVSILYVRRDFRNVSTLYRVVVRGSDGGPVSYY